MSREQCVIDHRTKFNSYSYNGWSVEIAGLIIFGCWAPLP